MPSHCPTFFFFFFLLLDVRHNTEKRYVASSISSGLNMEEINLFLYGFISLDANILLFASSHQ